MEVNPKVYEAILENMSEIIYVRDLNMNLLYINPAAERLTGWPWQDAVGKKCYAIFGDEGQMCKDVCPSEKAISERLSILHHEGQLKTRSGEVRDMQVSISPFHEDGAITGAVVVMKDVTNLQGLEQTRVKTMITLEKEVERRRIVEEELRESEHRYRTLVEQAVDAIFVVDAEGRLVDVNRSACESLGYSRDELLALSVLDIVVDLDRDGVEAVSRRLVNETVVMEKYHRRKDGSTFPVEMRGSLLELGGENVMLGLAHDITARKRMEDALQQRNLELALLNQTSQVFISILDLDHVLVTILEEIRSLLDVVACSIWLVDHETGELVCQQATGPGNQIVRGWRLLPGVGIVGWTVRGGESLIVPDTQSDERYYADVGRKTGLSLRSILSIPLRVKENVIGVFQAVAVEVNRFDATDLMLLEPLSASAAVAIENARLYERAQQEIAERVEVEQSLRQYAERLGILHEIEQAIRGVHVPEDIAPAALQRIGRLVPFTIAAVMTFDLKAGEAITLAHHSTTTGAGSAELARLSLEGAESMVDELRQGKVQVMEDILSLESFPPAIRVLKAIGIRSYVSAPLIVEGELIGSLNVGADTLGAFRSEHIEIVREVANQLAIALQQTRLRRQVERHAAELEQRVADRTRELQTLYDVTAIAGESQDLETVLEMSLGWSLAAVGCLAGAIHLLDETDGTLVEEKTLQLAAWQGAQSHDTPQVDLTAVDMGCLAKRVIELGKPLLASDMSVDPRTGGECVCVALSYAGVPMRSRGRVIGELGVVGRVGQQFRAEEVALLASIADHVAVAVENTRLRRDAERAAVMEERERLARELHDSVTQLLYSLSLFAETGRRLAKAGELQDAEDYLAQIGLTAQQALKEMRMLVHELRPPVLEQEGLVGALQQRLDAVERRTGVTASLFVEGEVELPVSVEKVLYHIAQEALNNALRHAVATSVQVCVRSDDDQVELEVVDDGSGFDLATASDAGGLGLIGIREWAERLGGNLTILSTPGEGSVVRVVCRGYFND